MRKSYFSMLAAVSMLATTTPAEARNILLPMGHFSQLPWECKYLFIGDSFAGDTESFKLAPGEDWFAVDFDDSAWKKNYGPVSTESGSLSYYNNVWEKEYGATYFRRHFTVDNPETLNEVILYTLHDDSMVVYLNGTKIYDRSYVVDEGYSDMVNVLSDEHRALLKEGDNVIAVGVCDHGGAYAYADFGLYGSNLANGAMEQYYVWSGSFDRGWSSDYGSGNMFGYRWGKDMNCQQTLENRPAGLYRLSANACGLLYYNNNATAIEHRDDIIPVNLFIGSAETPIPSVFSEPLTQGGDYRWAIENGKYVPNNPGGIGKELNQDAYACDVWTYYDPEVDGAELTLGIRSAGNSPTNEMWSVWDNLDLQYYSEKDVEGIVSDALSRVDEIKKLHFDRNLYNEVMAAIENVKGATDLPSKSKILADLLHLEIPVRRSLAEYSSLKAALDDLKSSMDKVASSASPLTLANARSTYDEVNKAYSASSYSSEDIRRAISDLSFLARRLGYSYLDVTVNTPGSLGDSILKHVENFVDVQSIKLSGTLNSDDIATLQNRLASLREIDMTDLNMTAIPERFFYQRSGLEKILLPSNATSIGELAMYQCTSLREVVFPSALKTVGEYAFYECRSLNTVELPEGLTSLGNYCFYYCTSLERVKFPASLAVIPAGAFNENIKLTSVEFSDGLTRIEEEAFCNCRKIEKLKFPSTLSYIGNGAFAYNSSLSNVEFNEGLNQIADNAFYDCDGLTEITLPSTLVFANASPFDYCDNLKKVTCLSIEPPYMTDQIPYGLSMEGRELYVPELSLNIYKQTAGWDKFQVIKPIEYLPASINVLNHVRLTLPENIPADYKPDVTMLHAATQTYFSTYGSLTVNGEGTLSIRNFHLRWDPSNQYTYGDYVYNSEPLPFYNSIVNNSHMRADNVEVVVYPQNNLWTFITFPFDVKMADIESICDGSTSWAIRRYDSAKRAAGATAETWVRVGDDETLKAGEGYIIQTSRYVGNSSQNWSGLKFTAVNNGNKNNIFLSDDARVELTENVSEFAHNSSWNLIGNPYGSYFDTRFMDFTAPLTVWNMNNKTYTAVSPVDDSYILCPGESFFVQRPVDQGTIVFSKDGRQVNRVARTIEEAETRSAADRLKFNFTLTDGTHTDRTRVVLNEQASMEYDQAMDAGKFRSSDPTVPQLFSTASGIEYAINERPFSDGRVLIGIHAAAAGIHTLSLTEEVAEYNALLEDTFTGAQTVLSKDKGYSFNSEAGDFSDRFVVRFIKPTSSVEGVEAAESEADEIYTIDGIKVENPVKGGVYIVNGRKVIYNK